MQSSFREVFDSVSKPGGSQVIVGFLPAATALGHDQPFPVSFSQSPRKDDFY